MNKKRSKQMEAPDMILLNTAERLFAVQGYGNTSIRQIAEEANANSSMVSYYFGSKEALFHHIFMLRLEDLKNMFEGLLVSHSSINGRLDDFLDSYTDHIQRFSNFHKLLLREYSVLSPPNLGNSMISNYITGYLSVLRQIVSEQVAKIPFSKIDITLFCVDIIVLTPRLLLENSRSHFNLIDALDGEEHELPITLRLKNYYYSQLFGATRSPY